MMIKLKRCASSSIKNKIVSLKNSYCNVPNSILEKVDRKIYQEPNNPINILKQYLKNFYENSDIQKSELRTFLQRNTFDFIIHEDPIVKSFENFDALLIPQDHVSRKKTDTFYITEDILLRTQTSAHQHENIKKSNEFCVFADVFRKDQIDSTHYPIFHQMENVALYQYEEIEEFLKYKKHQKVSTDIFNDPRYRYNDKLDHEKELTYLQVIENDLKQVNENLIKFLLGNPDIQMRWNKDYFPFTEPSFELEVFFNERWIEMLGSGTLTRCCSQRFKSSEQLIGWASGMGIERLAMLLFNINDIRLFWSKDTRFFEQFSDNKIVHFKPFSKYPPCEKDISFWFNENDFYELAREVGGELIEKVEKFDEFFSKKKNQKSQAYRIVYRSFERTLTNEEIDKLQFQLRDKAQKQLDINLR